MPVHLLNELVRQLPDGVYVTSVKQNVNTVAIIRGGAVQRTRFGAAAQPGRQQRLVHRPELVEIVAGNVSLEPATSAAWRTTA